MTRAEAAANAAISAAVAALQRAAALSSVAGYGAVLRGELLDAIVSADRALDMAEGRA